MDGTQENLSNEKIEQALSLLSEAARDKRDELMNLMSDKYANLKDAFFDGQSAVASTVTDRTRQVADRVRQATQMGQERARDMAARIDETVHESPWSYIGGIAIGALILGYMLGRRE